MEAKLEGRRILVGVDGSRSSRAALAWAACQAQLTGLPLEAVTTWELPTYGWSLPLSVDVDFEGDAKRMLEQTVAEVLGRDPGIEVVTLVFEGHAAPVLTEESRHADLVVVGCRGHGEFVGMLLGSVGAFLTTHAHCPVVVVRDDQAELPAA